MTADMRRAETDLVWLWSERDAALGVRSQSFDTAGGGESDLHERLTSARHRHAVDRESDLVERLRSLPLPVQEDLSAALTTRRWPPALTVALRSPRTGICLAGLACRTPEAISARERHQGALAAKGKPVTAATMTEWLEARAANNQRALLQPVRLATTRRWDAAVAAFAGTL